MSAGLHVGLAFRPGASRPVGRLVARAGRIYFEWDKAFLAAPLALSPFRLAPRPGVIEGPREPFEGLHGLFSESLPDAWGRLLMDRARRARGLPPASPLERLAMIGASGPGALVYAPEDRAPPPQGAQDLDALAEDARAALSGEIGPEALERLRGLGGSSGGARPKALLWFDPATGGLHADDAEGREAWIVKFRAPGEPEDAGLIEYVWRDLAARAGLETAPARLFPARQGPGWFGARRFDRGPGGARPHLQSLSALLEADHRLPSVGYDALIKAARLLCGSEQEAERAFRLMAFNMLAHNRDDHARNVAFLMEPAGAWRLAPAYDLTFSEGPGGEHSMDIAGEGRAPGRAEALRLAERTGIRARRAKAILSEVGEVLADLPAILAAAGVSRGSRAHMEPRLEAVRRRMS